MATRSLVTHFEFLMASSFVDGVISSTNSGQALSRTAKGSPIRRWVQREIFGPLVQVGALRDNALSDAGFKLMSHYLIVRVLGLKKKKVSIFRDQGRISYTGIKGFLTRTLSRSQSRRMFTSTGGMRTNLQPARPHSFVQITRASM